MDSPPTIRPLRDGEAPALLALFKDTVRRINARDYGPEQIAAWASDAIEPASWAARFDGRFVAVAEAEGRPVGFADLEDDGHLDRFFVAADFQGRGAGRALMQALLAAAERRGLERIFTDASITARPFFERHGFTLVAAREVVVRGVAFRNFRLERRVAAQ